MTQEACRIVIHERAPGIVDVGAPMKHKDLCYDILRDAGAVIRHTADHAFEPGRDKIVIVMSMAGVVDVAAPLPPRDVCQRMLIAARDVIERFNDDSAPPMRPFPGIFVGGA